MGDLSMADLPDAFTCPTCLDVFIDPCTVVPCGHSFCRACLENWLDRASGGGNTRCPLCGLHIDQAVLSYALRAATEAAQPEAVRARRAALNINPRGTPQEAHFHRHITPPSSPQRAMAFVVMFASIISIGAACVGIWWAIDWQVFATTHMQLIRQNTASRPSGFAAEQGDDVHAVSAASRSIVAYGLLALVVAGVLIWSSVQRAALLFRVGAQHNPDVLRIVEAAQQRVEDAAARLARLIEGLGALIIRGLLQIRIRPNWLMPDARRLGRGGRAAAAVAAGGAAGAADDNAADDGATRIVRLVVGGWFVLFILFFIVLQREMMRQLDLLASDQVPHPEDIFELGAAWAGKMPRMMVSVFIVTFAAVFTVLFSWQVLTQAVGQLRQ